ncbi:Cilium assembly protein DZIP1L [Trichinella spiralis]|uniref:Cilium assembly protein DZIP1L n=1 Tax=Trichinella spiralis TaxID=6334 RepID=A0ABR3KQ51_TRISP
MPRHLISDAYEWINKTLLSCVKTAVVPSSLANTCTMCGSSFGSFSGLQLHRKRAHPDVFAASCSKKTKESKHVWMQPVKTLTKSLRKG